MMLDTNPCRAKPPSLEEGPLKYERNHEDFISNRAERSNKCSRCMQFMKVILYVELILFIGWIGCIFLTNYYWEPRYNNADAYYDLPDSTHDQYIQDSSINSDPLRVSDAGRSIKNDDTKRDNEQSEAFTELTIEDKNYSIETEAPTTPSVSDIHDTNMEESILLSKWLSSLNIPEKSDDWAESSRKSDAIWDRMMKSIDDQNDKTGASSGEEDVPILTKDPDTGSIVIKNRISRIDATNDEFREMDPDDLTPLTFWLDFWSTGDYTDEMTDSEKDVVEDDRFKNMRFDFEFPDLVARHLLQQVKITDAVDDSDFSPSSEETKNPAPKAKRSTESSSSEETKNPPPKTKRSAESSSSESDVTNDKETDDKSDSSDSSSSENDRTTTEATEVVENCPKIVDENGKTIDDPREIVSHIKRNWFNWLLETPVPDCDGPKSAKTITIDECGKFVIRCTPAESDNDTSDKIKAFSTSHRDTRSIEENEVEWEKCERAINSTRKMLDKLMMQVVIGEASDPIVEKLRQNFMKAVMSVTLRVIVEQPMSGTNRTDGQWQDSMEEIRQSIVNSMDTEHRLQLEESGLSDQEVTSKLREIIESMSRIYGNCHNTLPPSRETRDAMRIIRTLVEREKCTMKWKAMDDRVLSLAAEIVTGETSDSTVVELRRKFKAMVETLVRMLAYQEMRDPAVLPIGPVNITDDQWRTCMIELQQELVNSTDDLVIRERIARAPPTQEQTNELRTIMEYYLREHRECYGLPFFEFTEKKSTARGVDQRYARPSELDFMGQSRDKRSVSADSTPESISVIKCEVAENDNQLLAERQARLEAWTTAKATEPGRHEHIERVLETIEPQLSAANPSDIPVANMSSAYGGMSMMMNHLLSNSSAELRKEGYELLRDVILEIREMESDVGDWKTYDTARLGVNFTECLFGAPENISSEMIFWIVVNAGRAGNLRYSGLGDIDDCTKMYKIVYGTFSYVGEEPEGVGTKEWRHILNGIIKLFFKIEDPTEYSGFTCPPSNVETTTTGITENEESKNVAKRSIGYPNRKSDNSVSMPDKTFMESNDAGFLSRANLGIDAQRQSFDMSLERFFDKMELLSSHIDRLHELYVKFNELNDDYVSREFPIESPLNNEYE